MKRQGLILAALVMPAAAQAERFGIDCEGTASFTHSQNGEAGTPQPSMPTRQTYVIDEETRTVHRALTPRQEFEDLCGTRGTCFRTFSPGLIRIELEIDEPNSTWRSELTLDRQSGRADYRFEMMAGTLRSAAHWQMTCVRGEIPIFDARGNRF